ncbi:MAG: hypothetical protein H5U29_09565, partial [Pusillimonas sp.]|nr:hypothetical protein [Pusillimonas sp.]
TAGTATSTWPSRTACEGVDQADDRGRRQRDAAGAGVDVGHGDAVEESTHVGLLQVLV